MQKVTKHSALFVNMTSISGVSVEGPVRLGTIRAGLVLFALLCIWYEVSAQEVVRRPESSFATDTTAKLSLAYLEGAFRLRDQNDTQAAVLLLRRGLEVSSDSSDLWLALSQFLGDTGGLYNEMVTAARNAVLHDRWIRGDITQALDRELELVLRVGDFDRVITSIDTRYSRTELLKYPRLLQLRIDAGYGKGDTRDSEALLRAAMQRYPDSASFVGLGLKYGMLPVSTAFLWFNRYPVGSKDSLEALFWYIRALNPSEERLSRITQYVSAGGADQSVYVFVLQSLSFMLESEDAAVASIDELETKWVRLFMNESAPVDIDAAMSIHSLIRDTSLKDTYSAWLNTTPQSMFRDYNRDKIPEERFFFSNGGVTRWIVDANQDDLTDLEVVLKDGRIESIGQERKGQKLRMVYAEHPEVSSAWVEDSGKITEYLFAHRVEEVAVLEMPDSGSDDVFTAAAFKMIKNPGMFFDQQRWNEKAYLVNQYLPSNAGIVLSIQTRFENRQKLASRHDTDSNGVFDQLIWYENDLPIMGFRDIQNDGEFSILDLYTRGSIVETRHHSVSEGLRYSYIPTTGRSHWDVNQDGIVDIREIRIGNRVLMQEFTDVPDERLSEFLRLNGYPLLWAERLLIE